MSGALPPTREADTLITNREMCMHSVLDPNSATEALRSRREAFAPR